MSQLRGAYKQVHQEDPRQQRHSSLLPTRSSAKPRFSAASASASSARQLFAKQVSGGSSRSSGKASRSSGRKRAVVRIVSDEDRVSEEESDETSEEWNGGMGDSDESCEDREAEEEGELPFAPRSHRQSMRTQSFMDRLKAKRTTKSLFGFHVNLAFKGAVFVVMGNLPMLIHPVQQMMPEQFWPVLGYVGLYLVFTLWKNLGDTIAFAFQGIVGAVMGTLNVSLTTMAIGGTTPESSLEYCFVWLVFVTFVALVLWLNFDGNTRCTALCTHVSYFMLLLKPEEPGVEKNLLQSFSVEEFWKYRVEVVNLMVVVAGTLLALLAASLPLVPVLPSTYVFKVGDALRYAEEEVQDLTMAMGQLVLDAVKGFGAHSESLVVDSFIAQAEHMHVRLQKLDDLSDAVWWEVVLDICPFAVYRRLRSKVIKDMHDILIGVLDNVIILLYTLKYEDFQDSHEDMMDEIEVPLEDLAQFFCDELNKALETLMQAQYERPQPSRKEVLKRKKALITDLGEAYMRTLKEIVGSPDCPELENESSPGPPARKRLSSGQSTDTLGESRSQQVELLNETMEESHFVYRLILMTDRLITRLERQEEYLEDQRTRCTLIVSLVRHLTNQDILFQPEHITFAIRQSITIVVSFITCMCYYHYSPTMAVTQSLLVNEGYTGSMLKKNLQRLQGVVIGTIFPHLFFDWFSECFWVHEVMLAIVLFLFEWISLYVYFSSEDFGYVGCLVGAFGAGAMCQGCGLKADTMKSLYLVMEQNAVGIALLTVIDLVFSPERASDLATRLLCHEQEDYTQGDVVGLLPLLQYGLASALQLDVKPGDQDASSLQRVAQVAQRDRFGDWNVRAIRQFRKLHQLGDEAYAEPRYMRRPWPNKLYTDVVNVCQGIRVDIIALTDAVGLQGGGAADHRNALFNENPEFKRFVRKLVKAFNRVAHMVRLAMKHCDEEAGEHGRRRAEIHLEAENLKIPTDGDMERLSRSLVDHPEFWKVRESIEQRRLSVRTHVLTDTFCRTSVAVCVLKNVARRLQRLHTTVVDST